ncbi:ribonuclease J [Dialister sp.]|uniref:ribonuclease J n=1 Tax=Dialister sp. TaxID=1955814 RepID=UPI002E800D1D|nr:ribonuclease J [Dialister sp.]MEE3453325.1 ribonuclease J [Dialister sp.]
MLAKARLQIIPLGGLGEIGKNMTVFRYGDEIIVIDAGMAFPEEDMLGIDIVIPDFSYLIENKDKIKAILITHGHEDHIGSLSYLLRDVNAPVYATKLTCGLIEGKLKEAHISNYDLHVVKSGDEFKAGSFKFGFFHVCHSIPDSCGIYLRTPIGTIVHSGDFKFDHSPVDGELTDMYKLAELGHRGVLVLCADSTNAQVPGYTQSEAVVAKSLMEAYSDAKGRIILATFASNVSRIQMAVDAAVAFKRKVCVFGRSMVNVVNIALEMGYLTAPEGTFIEPEEMNRFRDDRLCILTTGSQGEPMAGLSRMADGSHRQVQIHAGDTVIISASPIPGNETSVGRTIDNLMRLGAHLVTSSTTKVHVSGHGSQEDLKTMLSLVRPKFFIPVHGEYRMLCQHAELAESLGVNKQNILIGENGDIFEFTNKSAKINGKVQAGPVFVDGLGVGDVGNIVIRDRQQLAQDGVVIVVIALEKGSNQVLAGPDIVSRGFVYVRDSEALLTEARDRIESVLDRCEAGNVTEWNAIKTQIRDTLGKYFYDKTKRRPMILPIIQEVK